MSPQLALKLGILLGTLDQLLKGFDGEVVLEKSESDRLKALSNDVKKLFYEAQDRPPVSSCI
jgi:hypothetical protein